MVYCQNYYELKAYTPLVKRSTRTGSIYMSLGEVNIIPTKVVPISITSTSEDVVFVKGEGSSLLPPLRTTKPTFWESLMKGGGEWMWGYVSDRSSELLWLKTVLEQGMAVLAIDGSYSCLHGPNVSGAGWVIACRKCRKMLSGSFYEVSSNASPYQGELLGLVTLHTLVLHTCQYYQLTSAKGKIICDSKSALRESSKKRRQIRPGVAQGDLFSALCAIHQEMPGTNLIYEWVKSHQDLQMPWCLLPLEVQLNTTCNMLANGAVTRALTLAPQHTGPMLLPFERVAVVVNGVKITSQVAPAIQFALGKVDARRFYTKAVDRVHGSNKGGLGWSDKAFDGVDWEALTQTLSHKPESFQLLLSKQLIGVCAKQKNIAQIQDILDDCCPNCGKQGEDNKHLNRCTDPGRVKLFRDGIRNLSQWMNTHNQTNPELAFWIKEYLLHRELVRMTILATLRLMSHAFQEVAESQDEIGWVEFLHGKVSKKICTLQGAHCILASTNTNSSDWMRQFVQQLVEISHAQWLYHNFTLHHHVKRYLRQRTVKEICQEVELLTNT